MEVQERCHPSNALIKKDILPNQKNSGWVAFACRLRLYWTFFMPRIVCWRTVLTISGGVLRLFAAVDTFAVIFRLSQSRSVIVGRMSNALTSWATRVAVRL